MAKRLLPSLNEGKPRWQPLPKHWNKKFHSSFSLQELVKFMNLPRMMMREKSLIKTFMKGSGGRIV